MSTYLSKRFDFGSSFSSIGSAVTCRAVVCLTLIAARQCLPSCGCSARLLTAIGIYEIFLVCLLILMSQRGRGSPHGACSTSHTGSRHLSRSVCVCVCVYFCAMRQMISCNSIHMIHVCARALAVRKMIELKDTTRVRERKGQAWRNV